MGNVRERGKAQKRDSGSNTSPDCVPSGLGIWNLTIS